MSLARPALVDYRNNGKKPKPTFSAAEMKRRQDAVRGWMKKAKVDACVFTSYHNINYLLWMPPRLQGKNELLDM